MTGVTAALRRRRGGISADTKEATETFIRRRHPTFRAVDVSQLDDDEQAELVALVAKVSDGIPGGHNFNRLSGRETSRYEKLVEKSASLPAGQFKRDREAASLTERVRSIARRAARPAAPDAAHERVFIEEITRHVRDGFLHLDHVAVLVFIVGQLLTGEAMSPTASVAGEGDASALLLDRRYGLGEPFDPDVTVSPRWAESVDHVALNGWLRVDKRGHEWRVQLGPRTLELLR